jgi:hypothetical protein
MAALRSSPAAMRALVQVEETEAHENRDPGLPLDRAACSGGRQRIASASRSPCEPAAFGARATRQRRTTN